MKKRSLGSSLEDILGAVTNNSKIAGMHQKLEMIFLHKIHPGKYQPRKNFDQDSLKELANSIKEKGILQPIIVRKSNDEYEIIAGERRWRAAQIAGFNSVPAVVCNIENNDAIAFSLIENIQRQDLNPIEEALALKRLTEELSITHEDVAKSIGKSRAMITNTMRLLNLAEPVQTMLITRQLEMGHARALLSLSLDQQNTVAELAIAKKMTVRAVEQQVRAIQAKNCNKGENIQKSDLVEKSNQLTLLEEELCKKLGLVTKIQLKANGNGKFVCQFSNLNKLRSILSKLKPI